MAFVWVVWWKLKDSVLYSSSSVGVFSNSTSNQKWVKSMNKLRSKFIPSDG